MSTNRETLTAYIIPIVAESARDFTDAPTSAARREAMIRSMDALTVAASLPEDHLGTIMESVPQRGWIDSVLSHVDAARVVRTASARPAGFGQIQIGQA